MVNLKQFSRSNIMSKMKNLVQFKKIRPTYAEQTKNSVQKYQSVFVVGSNSLPLVDNGRF